MVHEGKQPQKVSIICVTGLIPVALAHLVCLQIVEDEAVHLGRKPGNAVFVEIQELMVPVDECIQVFGPHFGGGILRYRNDEPLVARGHPFQVRQRADVPRCPINEEAAISTNEDGPLSQGRRVEIRATAKHSQLWRVRAASGADVADGFGLSHPAEPAGNAEPCLLYTSDAADE